MEWALSDADTRNAMPSTHAKSREAKPSSAADQAPADLGGGRPGWNRRFPGLLLVGEQSTWPVVKSLETTTCSPRPKARTYNSVADVRSAHAGYCQVGYT